MAPPPNKLLEVKGLGKHFGGVVALADYDMEMNAGELVGLIGPNGAGKTTVFNLLSGVTKPTSGRIIFEGRDITFLRPDQNSRLGIARTFQNIRLFNDLTVLDNIRVAFHMRLGRSFWPTVLHLPGFRRAENEITQRSLEIIQLMELADNRHQLAGNLPYGLQRRVEIGRAIAALPRLLLLDEPAAGMNIRETEELVAIIHALQRARNLTILLVEHDMSVIMKICQRIQVLDMGRTLTVGSPEQVRSDPRVIEAYLGKPQKRRHAQG